MLDSAVPADGHTTNGLRARGWLGLSEQKTSDGALEHLSFEGGHLMIQTVPGMSNLNKEASS